MSWIALVIALAILLPNAWRASWRALDAHGGFSAWCGAVVVLPFLWQAAVALPGMPVLHLLGVPLLVLMFGRQLAMTGAAVAVLASVALQPQLASNLGVNLLLLAVAPAYCFEAMMCATARFLPRHLFVYLLGNGFFGALLTLVLSGLLSFGVQQLWMAATPMEADALAFMMLMAWGEAFLTGCLITIFTLCRPQWVSTFADEVYLQGR